MPGFDKMGYQTIHTTNKEDESNSQCKNPLDSPDNVKGMIILLFNNIYI